MTFDESLKLLNIEDYKDRIMGSSSHGELMHLVDYVSIAMTFKNTDMGLGWFRPLFVQLVESTAREWQRPESVYQHMPRLMRDAMRVQNP